MKYNFGYIALSDKETCKITLSQTPVNVINNVHKLTDVTFTIKHVHKLTDVTFTIKHGVLSLAGKLAEPIENFQYYKIYTNNFILDMFDSK